MAVQPGLCGTWSETPKTGKVQKDDVRHPYKGKPVFWGYLRYTEASYILDNVDLASTGSLLYQQQTATLQANMGLLI